MKPVFVSIIISGLLLASASRLFAHVEKTYFLKGNVGQQEIFIKMLCYDEMPVRHLLCFFSNDKRDQYMVGKFVRDAWQFGPEEKVTGENISSKLSFSISENKNGTWSGSIKDSTGQNKAILLKPIIGDSIASPFRNLPAVGEMNPYEQYRVANVHFTKMKIEKYGKDLLVEWLTEKESGISFFRLQSPDNKTVTDSINATLTIAHLSMVENFYQYRPTGFPPNLQSKITYLSKEMVSYQTSATIIGYASNPVLKKQFTTLDMHSGQSVNLEDFIWFGEKDNIPEPGDLFKIYKYRNNTFAPKVFALLQQLYPTKMQNDSCGINKMESWALPAWNLTNKGLSLSLKTVDQCDPSTWAIIPYEILKPFLGKKYHLKANYTQHNIN